MASLGGMGQRISLVTLGVDDLERSRSFYEALGWKGQEVEQTAFYQAGGSVLVLWGRDKLAADCGIADVERGTFDGVVLAHNVRSRGEVDDIMNRVAAAGGVVTRTASETFYGGYAAVFTDPDGHAWEVSHNPGFRLADDGS